MAAKSFTPSKLVAAIRAGDLGGVIRAIEEGADIEETDMHGFGGLPLRTACFAGNIEIVRELLERGADINAMAGDGPGAPLRLAERGGHQALVAFLLQGGEQSPSFGKMDSAPPSRLDTDQPQPRTAEAQPDNTIEFTSQPDQTIEEVDLTACYGLDTNLLTLDLLRLQEEPEPAPRRPSSKPGFWKSGR